MEDKRLMWINFLLQEGVKACKCVCVHVCVYKCVCVCVVYRECV